MFVPFMLMGPTSYPLLPKSMYAVPETVVDEGVTISESKSVTSTSKFTCAGDRCALVTRIDVMEGRYIPSAATGKVAILSELRRSASAEKGVELCTERAPSNSPRDASCGKSSGTN